MAGTAGSSAALIIQARLTLAPFSTNPIPSLGGKYQISTLFILKQISLFVSICSNVLSVYYIFTGCVKEIKAAGTGGSRPRPGPFSNAPH